MFSNTLPLIFVAASFQSGIKLAWPKAESTNHLGKTWKKNFKKLKFDS